MVVTSDILKLTFAGIKTDFEDAYATANEAATWNQIATEIPTTLPIQDYAFLGRGAVMQEFKARMEAQGVNELGKDYQLSDIIYNAPMMVSRRSLEDDQYGLLKKRTEGLASEPIRHWNQLTFEQLVKGFAKRCYDGQYFFDTDHQEGASGIQSNKFSLSLNDQSLEEADRRMMSMVDDKGVPMEITPNALVVGPALKRRASDLIGSDVVVINVGDRVAGAGAQAATNYSNYFNRDGKRLLIVNHYIRGAAAYNWFSLDTTKSIKPIVIQSRSDVPITIESDMDDSKAKMLEEYTVRVRGRYVAGYGLWQTAFGSDATE